MNCYINPNFSRVSTLRLLLLDNINIIPDTNNIINNENGIIISDCSDITAKNLQCNFLDYNSTFDYFNSYALRHYYTYYDYYYLLNALGDAFNECFDSIIVGSSYSCFGIDVNITTTKSKNLSVPSQDIYYGCKIAEKVINNNKNIKNIFIGVGYYSFFGDLSKTKNEEEIKRISDVYYPLLADKHNALLIPETKSTALIKSDIFDINRIVTLLSRTYYDMGNGNYFNKRQTRFASKSCLWTNPNLEWKDISIEEKIIAGEKRANGHNKSINYKISYNENINTLNDFVKKCNQNDISVHIIVFPSTVQYSSKLDKKHKKYFFEALDKIDGELHLIDFNNYDQFDDSDFNDMDHLNDNGAIKLTKLLNDIIIKDAPST